MTDARRMLALSVSRCPHVDVARGEPGHPCHRIVSLQSPGPGEWQVPEGWAGNLADGKILFISSNPSISEAGDAQSGEHVERYPRGDWDDEEIADFIVHRFNAPYRWATPEGRFRREDGTLSPRAVRFWAGVRNHATELLGRQADAGADYAMTEVVHCKSKQEKGVVEAAAHCADAHLDRIIGASPAPLVVILGGKARDLLAPLWELPAGLGRKHTVGIDEQTNLAVRRLGGHDRVVAYLWHPSGMTGPKMLPGAYPTRLSQLKDLVAGRIGPAAFTEAR